MKRRFKTLDAVDVAYEVAQTIKLVEHRVLDQPLTAFASTLYDLECQIRLLEMEEESCAALRPLRRFRFGAASTPLPLSHPSIGTPVDEVRPLLSNFARRYRELRGKLDRLSDLYSELTEREDSPVLSVMDEVLKVSSPDSTAVLCKSGRLIGDVQRFLEAEFTEHIEVVSVTQLKQLEFFDILVIPGAYRWYNHSVIYAPRAPAIHVIQQNWIHDSVPDGQRLDNGVVTAVRKSKSSHRSPHESSSAPTFEADAQSILPKPAPVNLGQRESFESKEDAVEAKRYKLAGGFEVFLGDQRCQLLELDDGVEVERVSSSEVVVGSYLVLKVGSSSSDFVREVADRIMGWELSTEVRGSQELWKSALREQVDQLSLSRVSRKIRSLGSTVATEDNIRNWLSNNVMGPGTFEDFKAVMLFLQVSEMAEEFWHNLKTIRSYHVKAGNEISRSLEEVVESLDPRELEQKGQAEFNLVQVEARALAAFRVEYISDTIESVPSSWLGLPYEVEEY